MNTRFNNDFTTIKNICHQLRTAEITGVWPDWWVFTKHRSIEEGFPAVSTFTNHRDTLLAPCTRQKVQLNNNKKKNKDYSHRSTGQKWSRLGSGSMWRTNQSELEARIGAVVIFSLISTKATTTIPTISCKWSSSQDRNNILSISPISQLQVLFWKML